MRIALDTQSTLGRKTGIGQYTTLLLAALRHVAPQHAYLELNWSHDVAMRTDRRLRWQQIELPRRARVEHADLLHVPGFDAPVRKPCPTVLTIHDLIGVLFPRNLPPISRLYWSRWLPFTAHFADAIIADSEATRRDILRLLRLPAEKITVVPLGVDRRFQPQSAQHIADCRARYGLPRHYILYTGTLEPRKGIDTLIDAFAALADRLPHELVLVGKGGWHWKPLLKQIAAQGLQARTRLLDFVPDGDLPTLYAGADAFVFPSRYEGFGLPVLEAMACGTPVVCSNAASLPEIADQAGLLIPPDDPQSLAEAIDRVLTDSTLAGSLREKGLQRAGQFTWDNTARATAAVYERVVKQARSG